LNPVTRAAAAAGVHLPRLPRPLGVRARRGVEPPTASGVRDAGPSERLRADPSRDHYESPTCGCQDSSCPSARASPRPPNIRARDPGERR
jgi:hypothetical protein